MRPSTPPHKPPRSAGTLFWSDPVTWLGTPHAATNGPAPGANVSIPFGWNLVIDASPPPLGLLLIEGNASFSSAADVNLTATYIVVQVGGRRAASAMRLAICTQCQCLASVP
jgi:hypothetical protein